MQEKTYTMKGTYRQKNREMTFSKDLKALNENHAKEKLFSTVGSKHKIKRNAITIKEAAEKKSEQDG